MSGPESKNLGEKLKSEIVEQTRAIMREMIAEFREERQAAAPVAPPVTPAAPVAPMPPVVPTTPPAPQYYPFDLDAETSGRQ